VHYLIQCVCTTTKQLLNDTD